MNLHEFNPFPVCIDWEGVEIKLRPFDLRAITWAERFFYEEKSGFQRMNEILSAPENFDNYVDAIVSIVFHLSEGFEKFEIFSAEELRREIFKKNEANRIILSSLIQAETYKTGISDKCKIIALEKEIEKTKNELRKYPDQNETIIGLKEALEEIFVESFPKKEEEKPKKGGAIYQALRQKSKKETVNNTDWEQIYIEFYKSGGMTIDEFYSLTIKQINILYAELKFNQAVDLHIESEMINKHLVYKMPYREMKFTEEDKKVFAKTYEKLVEQHRIN